ncbi:hypothetical protein VUR80DRAFT_4990 [Thermomyces stellatus]
MCVIRTFWAIAKHVPAIEPTRNTTVAVQLSRGRLVGLDFLAKGSRAPIVAFASLAPSSARRRECRVEAPGLGHGPVLAPDRHTDIRVRERAFSRLRHPGRPGHQKGGSSGGNRVPVTANSRLRGSRNSSVATPAAKGLQKMFWPQSGGAIGEAGSQSRALRPFQPQAFEVAAKGAVGSLGKGGALPAF